MNVEEKNAAEQITAANVPHAHERPRMTELERIRHSAAHVLATAILKIWPEAQFAAGPPVENGFYYDLELPHRISPEDVAQIEAEIRRRPRPTTPSSASPSAALKLWKWQALVSLVALVRGHPLPSSNSTSSSTFPRAKKSRSTATANSPISAPARMSCAPAISALSAHERR